MSERAIGVLKDFYQSFELAIGQPFYSKQFGASCFLVHLLLTIKYGYTNVD